MARYIDAEKAVEDARLTHCKDCYSCHGIICRSCVFDDTITFIEDYPAADVVPKSDFAREIFEEIEKIKKEYASGDIDGNELYVRLYLLEKKYTEEHNERK